MAKPSNQIKADFEASLRKFGLINDALAKNIENKRDFSRLIIDRLGRINQLIQELAGKIKMLKDELANLKGRVASNVTEIDDKNREMQDLARALQEMTLRNNEAREAYKVLSDNSQKEKQQLQQALSHTETQLQTTNGLVTRLTAERDALQQELTNRGDPNAHAQEIQNLTDAHGQNVQQQQEQHRLAINDLMEKKNRELEVATAESQRLTEELRLLNVQIHDTQEQHAEQLRQIQLTVQQLTAEKNALTTQIQDLQTQIQTLTDENNDLIQRIIAATRAISDATNNLRQITDNDPAQFNQDEINETFANLEASIQAISNSLSGNGPQNNNNNNNNNNSSSSSRSSKIVLPLDTMITVKDNKNNDLTFTLDQIMIELRSKGSRVAGIDKYETASNAIKSATTPQEVAAILAKNNIIFKNGAMMGGKYNKTKNIKRRKNKTRKNKTIKNKTRFKRQKGGFIYSSNTKRKPLSNSFSKDIARGRK
jgi:DNA repair exonuclease SbcCD ATPase subunit